MRYPCAIETGNGVYGVIFPDLPGCYPSGETLEDAFKDAKEAAESWMDAMADEGLEIPAPSAMDDVVKNPDYKGWVFGSVDIDMSKISDKAERVNITLPKRVLRRLDNLAKESGDFPFWVYCSPCPFGLITSKARGVAPSSLLLMRNSILIRGYSCKKLCTLPSQFCAFSE